MDPVSKIQNAGNSDKPGYGRPPREHQWKKGQSGNPSGRPKDQVITEICKEIVASVQGRKAIKDSILKLIKGPKGKPGMAAILTVREVREVTQGKIPDELHVTDFTSMTDDELQQKLQALLDARIGP